MEQGKPQATFQLGPKSSHDASAGTFSAKRYGVIVLLAATQNELDYTAVKACCPPVRSLVIVSALS